MDYDFTVILADLDEMTTSAIADVQKAGGVVRKVEIEPQVVRA